MEVVDNMRNLIKVGAGIAAAAGLGSMLTGGEAKQDFLEAEPFWD